MGNNIARRCMSCFKFHWKCSKTTVTRILNEFRVIINQSILFHIDMLIFYVDVHRKSKYLWMRGSSSRVDYSNVDRCQLVDIQGNLSAPYSYQCRWQKNKNINWTIIGNYYCFTWYSSKHDWNNLRVVVVMDWEFDEIE